MKVPAAKRLPSGNWFIRLRLGGESIPITAPTEKACIKQATLRKAEYVAGVRRAAASHDTLTAMIDTYISRRSAVLSPATIRGYRIVQNNRFQSVMQKQASAVKSWQAVINKEAPLCSAKTLKNAWGFVRSVLKENNIDPGSLKLPQIVREERPFLQPSEIPTFLKAIEGAPCEMAALLALHSLRRSELLAVNKKAVKDGRITVKGSIVPDEHGKMQHRDQNKTAASARTVPILIPRLQELIDKIPDGPLVTMHPEAIRRSINRVCKKANLPQIGLHGLRHTFASLCYHKGVSEMECMALGGWSDYATMRRIYTHLADEDALAAETKLKDFFKNGNENGNETAPSVAAQRP